MGEGDKALIDLAGQRMIDHVLARIRPQVDAVLISGPTDFGTGLATIPDEPAGLQGPVGGLVASARFLAASQADATMMVTVPVDAPFLPTDLVERLCDAEGPAIARAGGRLHPTFAAWDPNGLIAALGDFRPGDGPSLQSVIERVQARIVDFDDPLAFTNINTPAEADEARLRLTSCNLPSG